MMTINKCDHKALQTGKEYIFLCGLFICDDACHV